MAESSEKLRRRAAVINGYKQGMTIKDLENKYGISAATIKTYLRDEKIRSAEATVMIQQDRLAERNEAIREDIESGPSAYETAEKEGTSCSTVWNTLRAYRTSVISPQILLSEIDMRGRRKGTIRRWAEKQIGSTLKTPEGDMLITAVYPFIFECFRHTPKRDIKTTYTHAQLYYINQEDSIYGEQTS